VNGHRYATCREACIALELLEDDGEWHQCLDEACTVQVGLSVLSPLMKKFWTMAFSLFNSIWPGRMLISICWLQTCYISRGIDALLIITIATSSANSNLRLTGNSYRKSLRQLRQVSMLANKQHIRILTKSNRSSSFMAQGGLGKHLFTTLLLNGSAVHSMFKIPIPCNEDSTCNVKKQSPLANLFHVACMIVWDEASMSHHKVFGAVNHMLQDV